MFGRRRRAARAAEARELELRGLELRAATLTAPLMAPVLPAAAPTASAQTASAPATVDLTADAVTDLLHRQLNNLIGTDGIWTLVPRSSDDTEVFFHELQAREIARLLSSALQTATARVVATSETSSPAAMVVSDRYIPATSIPDADFSAADIPAPDIAVAAEPVSTSTLTTPITEPAEPTALPWTPRPVAHWADPSARPSSVAPARDKVSER